MSLFRCISFCFFPVGFRFRSVCCALARYVQRSVISGGGKSRRLKSTSVGISAIKRQTIFSRSKNKTNICGKIQLTATDQSGPDTTSTNERIWIFNRLRPLRSWHGKYQQRRGLRFSHQSPSMDKEASPSGRTMTTTINLKSKGTAARVSKIPKPAREAYIKGMEAMKANDSKKLRSYSNRRWTLIRIFALH